MNTQMTIIGAGNMGEALAAALIQTQTMNAKDITMVDRHSKRLAQLQRILGVSATTETAAAVSDADVVILAVKPQDADPLCASLVDALPERALVVSIMAGVQIRQLQSALHHKRIVRAMPNTPALIQQGMTVWKAAAAVTAAQKRTAQRMFAAAGEELEVRSEDMIDAATAVSGSGPAYVFAFVEYLVVAARDVGFSRTQAEQLVEQTVRGATQLLLTGEDDAATLREKVTSKKGTTEAALNVLKKERAEAAFTKAVRAAYARAQELSQE